MMEPNRFCTALILLFALGMPLHGTENNDDAMHRALANHLRAGQLPEAEEILFQLATKAIETHGPEDDRTLRYRNHLADVHYRMGWFEEARQELQDLLPSFERLFGPDHKDTLVCRGKLVGIMKGQGKLADAEKAYRALAIRCTESLGPDHELTLSMRKNLANLHQELGQVALAEQETRLVLDDLTRLFGRDHAFTQDVRNNLALILLNQHKHEEAERMHRELLALRLQATPYDPISVAASHANIAYCLEPQGKRTEALEFAKKAEALFHESVGDSHPDATAVRKQRIRLEAALNPATAVPTQD